MRGRGRRPRRLARRRKCGRVSFLLDAALVHADDLVSGDIDLQRAAAVVHGYETVVQRQDPLLVVVVRAAELVVQHHVAALDLVVDDLCHHLVVVVLSRGGVDLVAVSRHLHAVLVLLVVLLRHNAVVNERLNLGHGVDGVLLLGDLGHVVDGVLFLGHVVDGDGALPVLLSLVQERVVKHLTLHVSAR